jgi:hypothetical protein
MSSGSPSSSKPYNNLHRTDSSFGSDVLSTSARYGTGTVLCEVLRTVQIYVSSFTYSHRAGHTELNRVLEYNVLEYCTIVPCKFLESCGVLVLCTSTLYLYCSCTRYSRNLASRVSNTIQLGTMRNVALGCDAKIVPGRCYWSAL